MVLRVLFAVLCLAAGCVKSTAPPRLSRRAAVTVAFVHQTSRGWSARVPGAFTGPQIESLAARNMAAQKVGGDSAERLAASKLTRARLASLAHGAATPIVVLIETASRYDSQLAGRYRWTVYAKITVADARDIDRSVSQSFDVPVILQYDHQEDDDALADAAHTVSTELGKVLDSYLASYGEGAPAPSPAGPPGAAGMRDPRAIYLVMIDRFADGDPTNNRLVDRSDPEAWHGGDLAGVTAHLDDIQRLGFDTVWLTPHTRCRETKFVGHGAFHCYWTTDLGALEPAFGTAADLAKLAGGLERRHMGLILDLVLNHVAPEAALQKRHPDWFHHLGPIEDWHDPVQVTRGEVHGLPDLDQDNPEVYDYLLAGASRWARLARPVGFRLDAVRHVGADFWRRFLPALRRRAGRPLFFIGEIFDGDPAVIRRGFATGFDRLFDFPLYYAASNALCRDQPLAQIAAVLTLDRTYPDPTRLITFADNHDLPRLASLCKTRAARDAMLLATLAVRGTPSVTWGTEVGLKGAGEPTNRGDMRFGALTEAGRRIRALLAARREHPSLGGEHQIAVATDDLLVWIQRPPSGSPAGSADAVVAISRAATPRRVSLPTTAPLEVAAGGLGDGLESCGSGCLEIAPGASGIAWANGPMVPVSPTPRRVHFRARGVPAGGRPVIVGSVPELGSWRPADAPADLTAEIPRGDVIAFKLALRRADGTTVFEGGGNRYLLVDDSLPEEIELTWQK